MAGPIFTPEEEAAGRAAVLKEIAEWIGTPYVHMGRIKGKGGAVDCAQSIWAIHYNVGLTDFMPLENYPADFMCHRNVEIYMNIVLSRAREITFAELKAADVVLYKIGRVYAHGAIVVEPGWPQIAHADASGRAFLYGLGEQGRLARCDRRYFTRW